MHLLIGFSIFIGLIAFAFGGRVAVSVVRAAAFVLIMLTLAVVTYFATGVRRDLSATHDANMAKIPEDTPELRHICKEWLSHPDDAPRMCFAVLP